MSRFSPFVSVVSLILTVCVILYWIPWLFARYISVIGIMVSALLLLFYLFKHGKLTQS